jgi:hypothetical protein
MSSVTGGLPGDSNRVEHTFATGPAHALEPDTENALCDPSVHLIDSTIRSGWPPALGDACPSCLSMTQDRLEVMTPKPGTDIPSIALTQATRPNF